MKPSSSKNELSDDLLKIVKGFIDYLEAVDDMQLEESKERSDRQ